MSFLHIALIALAAVLIISFITMMSRPWYIPLYTKSSRSFAKYRREMMYIESLILKYAYEKGVFTREGFYEYIPGIEECPHCRNHVEMAIFTMIAGNRLQSQEERGVYMLTEHVKELLEYIDEHPRAHALSIFPMQSICYQHKAIHSDHPPFHV